jgi:hypothetical protein
MGFLVERRDGDEDLGRIGEGRRRGRGRTDWLGVQLGPLAAVRSFPQLQWDMVKAR